MVRLEKERGTASLLLASDVLVSATVKVAVEVSDTEGSSRVSERFRKKFFIIINHRIVLVFIESLYI